MKAIILNQDDLIVCDNTTCDFKIKNEGGDPNADISQFVNMPCPKCGDNLLTEKDYKDSLLFMKGVNFINKWFGWVSIFGMKKYKKGEKTIKIHNGVKFK